jgi:sulfatase maturation enzyme AslB (radical SAM superfamily)
MTLGRFAIHLGEGKYYDSLRHNICAEDELEAHYLLAGQEKQAILARLSLAGKFQILLIPSFECNLRCPQCSVGHLLSKPTGNLIGTTDPKGLISFIAQANETLGPLIDLAIVGGEPFLHPEAFRQYLRAGLPVSTTTNGIFDFDEVRDIIGQLKHITFSIDGWPEQHNRTRKSLQSTINPFETAYRNLYKTTSAFPDLSVIVQGTIIDNDCPTDKDSLRYFSLMLIAGVKRDKITLGPCAATLRRTATTYYSRTVSNYTRTSPCCDHLLYKTMYVHNNKIYGSYYQLEEHSPIAGLDDSIEDILTAKERYILETMPLLKDDICMNECNAVGVCWGMCTSDRHVFVDGKPSTVCNREFKEAKVLELVARSART